LSLLIDQAVEPENCVATPANGGSLAASTTYYYRVAVVTDRGEDVAGDHFTGLTTGSDKKLILTWNAVTGVKAVGGYKIYRNTSDVWTSGSHLLATVNTNTYTDDGTVSLTAGVPVTFTCTDIQEFPVGETSIIPDTPAVGVEGGEQSYIGSHSQRINVKGVLYGVTAKANLDILGAIRVGGVPVRVTFTSFTQTWILSNYLINSLQYWPEPNTQDVAGGAVLKFIIDLIEST
jgi:hypothetical protein